MSRGLTLTGRAFVRSSEDALRVCIRDKSKFQAWLCLAWASRWVPFFTAYRLWQLSEAFRIPLHTFQFAREHAVRGISGPEYAGAKFAGVAMRSLSSDFVPSSVASETKASN